MDTSPYKLNKTFNNQFTTKIHPSLILRVEFNKKVIFLILFIC